MTDQQHGASGLLSESVGTWTLDPAASTIELHTKAMWGLAKVKATFTVIEGSGVVAADGDVTGTLVVDAALVDTGNAKRDEHLRGSDFFEVTTYPTFTYAATGAALGADGVITFTGTLTVHGQTHPLSLTATATPAGTDRVTVTAKTEIDRSQWGLTWSKMGAGLHNRVTITAAFTKS
jgi:polyisoprenoid-binding protein YceI